MSELSFYEIKAMPRSTSMDSMMSVGSMDRSGRAGSGVVEATISGDEHFDALVEIGEMLDAAPLPAMAHERALVAHAPTATYADHSSFDARKVGPVTLPDLAGARMFVRYMAGSTSAVTVSSAAIEWVVTSGIFRVESGAAGRRATLAAGSWFYCPPGQPHRVKCIEGGEVFVTYHGTPNTSPGSFSTEDFEKKGKVAELGGAVGN